MAAVHGGRTPKFLSLENTELHNPGCPLERQRAPPRLQVPAGGQGKLWKLSFPRTGSFLRSPLTTPC